MSQKLKERRGWCHQIGKIITYILGRGRTHGALIQKFGDLVESRKTITIKVTFEEYNHNKVDLIP